MQTDARLKQPDDLTTYPGKLDHSTCMCFRVGSILDPSSIEESTRAAPHPASLPPAWQTAESSSPPSSPIIMHDRSRKPRSFSMASSSQPSEQDDNPHRRNRTPTLYLAKKKINDIRHKYK